MDLNVPKPGELRRDVKSEACFHSIKYWNIVSLSWQSTLKTTEHKKEVNERIENSRQTDSKTRSEISCHILPVFRDNLPEMFELGWSGMVVDKVTEERCDGVRECFD